MTEKQSPPQNRVGAVSSMSEPVLGVRYGTDGNLYVFLTVPFWIIATLVGFASLLAFARLSD
ncbi:hypothetical protein [Novipirellula artificiosorum]|uniref:hypothetical protein n=1 Tax=Novipirellula artificiosorum TaxID=2528016 RepID=UPI0011B7AD91|nr:hypothetical protein [Novipirellula artificiosorum]